MEVFSRQIYWLLMVVLLVMLLFTSGWANKSYPFSPNHGAKLVFKELLLKVQLNQQDIAQATLILQDKNHRSFISRHDLDDWKIITPNLEPVFYNGQAYYPLDDIPDVHYSIDFAQMMIKIQLPAKLFKRHEYSVPTKKLTPQKVKSIGGYLNYDLNIPPEKQGFKVNGLFGAGIFGPVGVINSDFLGNSSMFKRDVIGIEESITPVEQGFIRLNSTWIIDQPENMLSIKIGDSITQPGMWGNAVGFGGIQVGTNFATQPRFITYPLPTIAGEAVMPSIVDLYINNALVYQRKIPSGPFDINSLPVLTGQGQVSLVSRDLLGREQVVDVPYYASSHLLKPGLNDYSLAAGFIRNNFGIESNDYSHLMAVGTLRQGVTDNFTREFHLAIEKKSQVLGGGAAYRIGNWGVVDGAVAISHRRQGMGGLVEIGIERNARHLNFGADVMFTTSKFEQLGQSELLLPPKLQGTVFLGLPLAFNDSVGVSVVSQVNQVQPSVTLLSANYTRRMGNYWSVIFSGLTNLGGITTKGAFLTLTRRFGSQDTATVNGNSQNGANQFGLQYNHNSVSPNGLDYYASALPGKDGNIQGGANIANEFGDYSAQVANQNNITSYTANASGSVAYLSGQWQFSKRITNSFGVVQVPDYEGIGIYVDNQLVAHTNTHGYAFIPDLRAYDDNKITIDPAAIPMNAKVRQAELHAVPYYHSGVLMTFDVHADRDALLAINLASGNNLPAGANVKIKGQDETFPVAYNGVVYVTGLADGDNTLIAQWDGHRCQFTLNYQQTDNPLPNLGRFTCNAL